MKKIVLSFTVALIFAACVTGRTTVSEGVDMRKYKIAAIHNIFGYSGAPSILDFEIVVFDTINKTGIKMIGEKEIDGLSDDEKGQLMIIKFSAIQTTNIWGTPTRTNASVGFIDYNTEKPVASFYVTADNREFATEEIIKRIRAVFSGDASLPQTKEKRSRYRSY
jgi:hypothetical protein